MYHTRFVICMLAGKYSYFKVKCAFLVHVNAPLQNADKKLHDSLKTVFLFCLEHVDFWGYNLPTPLDCSYLMNESVIIVTGREISKLTTYHFVIR